MIWTLVDDIYLDDCWILNNADNFHRYPVRAAIFLRYPTMILTNELPLSFRNTYFAEAIHHSSGYGGYDGLVLGNLAMLHNFSVEVVNTSSYGSKRGNKDFTGANIVVFKWFLLTHFLYSRSNWFYSLSKSRCCF